MSKTDIQDAISEIAIKCAAVADLMKSGVKGIDTAETTVSSIGWFFYDSMNRIDELVSQLP